MYSTDVLHTATVMMAGIRTAKPATGPIGVVSNIRAVLHSETERQQTDRAVQMVT